MKLLASSPHAEVLVDARPMRVLVGAGLSAFVLVASWQLAGHVRPDVEAFFAAMSASTLTLFGGMR